MRVRLILAVVALASAAMLPPPETHAQLRDPLRIATAVADCFTATMPNELTGPAWVEGMQSSLRVVVPLRGQPNSPFRGAQSPPPPEDALAWFDLRRFDDEARLSDDWNAISPYRVNTESAIYIVDAGGYFWPRSRHVSQLCLEAASGGRYQPSPN